MHSHVMTTPHVSPPIVRINDIRMVPVQDLKPHPKNPNVHPKAQIQRLADILQFQGWRYPVKVSTATGYVTSGHARIEAAKLMGWTEVPVSYQDYDSEAQEFADVVADNAISEWSTLDLSTINLALPDLGPDLDMEILGFKDFRLDPAEKPTAIAPPTTGERKSTQADDLDTFLANPLRNMVFVYPVEQHAEMVRLIDWLKERHGIQDSSEVLHAALMELWNNHAHNSGD